MQKWHLTVSIGKKYEPSSTRKQSVCVQCLEIWELPGLLRNKGQYPVPDASQHQMLEGKV